MDKLQVAILIMGIVGAVSLIGALLSIANTESANSALAVRCYKAGGEYVKLYDNKSRCIKVEEIKI